MNTSSIKPTRPANGSPEGGRAKTLFSVVGGRRPTVCPPSNTHNSGEGLSARQGLLSGINRSLATVIEGTTGDDVRSNNMGHVIKAALLQKDGWIQQLGSLPVSDLSRGSKSEAAALASQANHLKMVADRLFKSVLPERRD